MRKSFKVGINFGITSGIITTLGLMVGLAAGTQSKMIVFAGILTIAIADSFSDALGIHLSEESDEKNTHKQVWESTISAFSAKFIFTLSFLLPIIFFDFLTGIIVNIVWGIFALCVLSYLIAKSQSRNVHKPILEHLLIAVVVIGATYFCGNIIASYF